MRTTSWMVTFLCVVLAGPAAATPGARVPPYRVTPTLQGVENARLFRGTAEQRKLLADNLFVVSPTNAEQLFFIYENNDYATIPSFVTTDLMLQLYHVFFNYTLRKVETQKLLPLLARLTDTMLKQSLSQWRSLYHPALKAAALRNVAYFGVASRLLGMRPELPPEARSMAEGELALIEAHEGFELGKLFPYRIDYSQFVPRGHYTRTEALKRYFKTMMWYGLAPFAFFARTPEVTRCDEPIRMGILLTRGLSQSGMMSVWERLYEPTAFFVGFADDLTPAEYQALMDEVFGKNAPITALTDAARFNLFVARGKGLRTPATTPRFLFDAPDLLPIPDPATCQLRLMGQRSVPDSEVLQRLSQPRLRPFPAGMDVMAVLGSSRARWLLDEGFPDLFDTRRWTPYRTERAR
ncbi:MAG: DUF3160 domain-containing protein, partial [Armatimonadota bacterium]|nr:DUF3160 domain-containing protein [Armatimonadota bacterium]